MNKNAKLLLLLVTFATALLLLAGCGGGSKTTSQNKAAGVTIPEKDKDYVINLGYYNCDHMVAACIAKDMGYYDQAGLKVNVTGNGKVPEAMTSGQMDVGYISNSKLMQASLKGSPILVAANNHLTGSHYLVASNAIKDPKDLVGKKLAIGTNPEKNSATWIQYAKRLGIPLEGKNYEVFDMEDRNKYVALKAGQLDAFDTCDPWASMAEYEGIGRILIASDRLPDGQTGESCVLSMHKKFYNEHPEMATLMIQCHVKALQLIYTNPVRAAEIFAENYKVPVEVALKSIYKKTIGEGRTMTWKVDPAVWERQMKFELDSGIVSAMPQMSDFIDTKLMEASGVDDFDTFIKDKVDPVFPLSMSYEDWKNKAYEVAGKKA